MQEAISSRQLLPCDCAAVRKRAQLSHFAPPTKTFLAMRAVSTAPVRSGEPSAAWGTTLMRSRDVECRDVPTSPSLQTTWRFTLHCSPAASVRIAIPPHPVFPRTPQPCEVAQQSDWRCAACVQRVPGLKRSCCLARGPTKRLSAWRSANSTDLYRTRRRVTSQRSG